MYNIFADLAAICCEIKIGCDIHENIILKYSTMHNTHRNEMSFSYDHEKCLCLVHQAHLTKFVLLIRIKYSRASRLGKNLTE